MHIPNYDIYAGLLDIIPLSYVSLVNTGPHQGLVCTIHYQFLLPGGLRRILNIREVWRETTSIHTHLAIDLGNRRRAA